MKIEAPGGAGWHAELPAEKIVLAIDLYDSPRLRLERSNGSIASPEEIARYAETFLRHNAIIYEMYARLESQYGARLVNFVADAALLTFDVGFHREALRFALEVAETLGQSKLETSIGIDIGAVALFSLQGADGVDTGFEQLVGVAVDRAVRLSWIARPSEVLVSARVAAAAPSIGEDFLFNPEGTEVSVSLDKWHPAGADALGIRTVSLPGQLSRPLWGNTREFSRYVHELLEAMEQLQEKAPYQWASAEKVLDDSYHPPKWGFSEQLIGLIQSIAVPLQQPPPELVLFPELDQACNGLSAWCTEVEQKAVKLQELLRQGSGTWNAVDEEGSHERLVGHITSVITAGRAALGRMTGGTRVR